MAWKNIFLLLGHMVSRDSPMGLSYEIKPVDLKNPNNTRRIVRRIVDIINYYIEDSEGICADYHDKKITSKKIENWMVCIKLGYPFYVAEANIDGHLETIGFGFLFPHGDLSIETFRRTAEIAIYMDHDHRGNGAGKAILGQLVTDAKAKGIDNILSSPCSKNVTSIEFFEKHGFEVCGRLVRAGKKNGEDIDIVWLQRFI